MYRANRVFSLSMATLFILSALALGQSPIWTSQLGTDSTDLGLGSVVDQLGNVYTSGYSRGSLAGGNMGSTDAVLLKHDASGKLVWDRQFGTSNIDTAFGTTVDKFGDVYITGYTYGDMGRDNPGGEDAWVAKYDSAGNQIWLRQFGTKEDDRAFAVVTDSKGAVYVCGDSNGDLGGTSDGSRDAIVRKYSNSGAHQWTRRYGGKEFERTDNITCDDSDNVIVAGAVGAYFFEILVAKYDSNGNQQWLKNYGTGNENVNGVVTDSLGNIYVSGETFSKFGNQSFGFADAFVLKLDPSGEVVWVKQYGTDRSDRGDDIVVDPDGNLVVTGRTTGDLGAPNSGGDDIFVAKFSPSGDELWAMQFGSDMGDEPKGIGVAGNNIFISGYTYGSMQGTNAGQRDVFVSSVRSLTPVVLPINSLTVNHGNRVAGGEEELLLSDDVDLTLTRRLQDVQARTEFEIESTSPTSNPFFMSFKIEGSVFARTSVQQSLELYDFSTNKWSFAGSVPASRFDDIELSIQPGGNPARFIEPGTGMMRARVRFLSDNPRQRFSSNTDHIDWTVSD